MIPNDRSYLRQRGRHSGHLTQANHMLQGAPLRFRKREIAGFLCRVALLGLVVAAVLFVMYPNLGLARVGRDTSATSLLSFNQAITVASPAVVNIVTDKLSLRQPLNLAPGLGSGVIVSDDGYIITCSHVIKGASKIFVILQDNRPFLAQLIGKDRRTDLAVLKIQANKLRPIPQAKRHSVNTGSVVLAIGNPFNLGQSTTVGIVSAIEQVKIGSEERQTLFQVDAAINEGNSGGALVNNQGELIAITTTSFQDIANLKAEGISFAIPWPLVQKLMRNIIADGRVVRGHIGIRVRDIGHAPSLRLNKISNHVEVDAVVPNSPAQKAGIQVKDVLLKINNVEIDQAQQALEMVINARPGSWLKVEVLRNTKRVSMQVGVEPEPEPEQSASSHSAVTGKTEGVTDARSEKTARGAKTNRITQHAQSVETGHRRTGLDQTTKPFLQTSAGKPVVSKTLGFQQAMDLEQRHLYI